jgi:surface polysaccharide O-acyltransferase-like enzyme
MSRKLLILNGLAAIAIAVHHAAAYGLQAMFQWTDRYRSVTVPNYDMIGSPAFHVTMLIRVLVFFAVPAFFFVSGYFVGIMARGSGTPLKWTTAVPRIKVLAIPFVLWTVVRYVLLGSVPTSLDEIMNPYFFIPVLVQFYLVAGLIAALAMTRWKLVLLVAGAMQLGLVTLSVLRVLGVSVPGQEQISNIPRWIFVMWPFWFPFGVVTGIHLDKIRPVLVPVRRYLLVAVFILPLLSVLEYQALARLAGQEWLGPTFGGYGRTLYGLAIILAFLAHDRVSIPFASAFAALGTKSLGIYMGNIPAIYVVAVMMYYLVPWALGNQLLYQGVLIAVGLGGPLLLMEIVRRSKARPLYRFVFG